MLNDQYFQIVRNRLWFEKKAVLNEGAFLSSEEEAKQFINNTFEYIRKRSVIMNAEKDTIEGIGKSVHTVSAYLLGLYLQQIACSEINKLMGKEGLLEHNNPFDYVWRLCCLYHDTYAIGEDKGTYIISKTLPSFIKDHEIKNTIYTVESSTVCGRFKPTYKQETVEEYYRYRHDHFANKNQQDHGIVAGYRMFDGLVNNLQNKIAEHKGETEFIDEGVHWDARHISYYAYVADAIIVHNIWHNKTWDGDDGMDYSLSEVTLDDPNEKKLTLEDDTLAFFLSLIDTIEPVKYFMTSLGTPPDARSEISILENIEIQYVPELRRLILRSKDDNIYNSRDWYCKKIKDLGDWLAGVSSYYCPMKKEIVIELGDKRSL